MLIKYLGAGDSARSFIEPLQRYVTVGEVVKVKRTVADGLLATGRWRQAGGKSGSSPPAPSAGPVSKAPVSGKRTRRRPPKPDGGKREPSIPDNKERQPSQSEVSR